MVRVLTQSQYSVYAEQIDELKTRLFELDTGIVAELQTMQRPALLLEIDGINEKLKDDKLSILEYGEYLNSRLLLQKKLALLDQRLKEARVETEEVKEQPKVAERVLENINDLTVRSALSNGYISVQQAQEFQTRLDSAEEQRITAYDSSGFVAIYSELAALERQAKEGKREVAKVPQPIAAKAQVPTPAAVAPASEAKSGSISEIQPGIFGQVARAPLEVGVPAREVARSVAVPSTPAEAPAQVDPELSAKRSAFLSATQRIAEVRSAEESLANVRARIMELPEDLRTELSAQNVTFGSDGLTAPFSAVFEALSSMDLRNTSDLTSFKSSVSALNIAISNYETKLANKKIAEQGVSEETILSVLQTILINKKNWLVFQLGI